jgi:predicted patatin/cPLA2 family phospholipase
VISQLIFYLVIDHVISDNTLLAIIIVSVSSGIGNLIAFIINDKFKKDSKWSMVLTSSDVEDVKHLCNYLAANNIKYIANDGYNRRMERTINIIAFSKTKAESKLIEKYLESTNSKYLKEII